MEDATAHRRHANGKTADKDSVRRIGAVDNQEDGPHDSRVEKARLLDGEEREHLSKFSDFSTDTVS